MNLSGAVLFCLFLAANSDEETSGVPSQPRNVTVLRVSSNSLKLSWLQPEKPNGLITGYRVYYMHANYTEVQSMRNVSSNKKVEFELTNLKPFTDYKIWLKAFTGKYEGEPSAAIYHKTDVKGPSAPQILNVTCHSHDTIYLQWERPTEFYNTIDYYYILYRDEFSSDYKEIMTQTSKEHLETMMFLPNLTTNTVYEIKIKGASHSIFNKDQILGGEESVLKKVEIRPNCDKEQTFLEETEEELSPGVIAGLVCVGCSLVFTAVGFLIWRKCFHVNYYYLDDPPRINAPTLVDWDSQTEQKTAVPIELFAKHVISLHADGDIGFSKEYEAIQASSTQEEYTSEHSLHPDNKQKNRYLNILAYDHSRVQLLPVPGQKKSVDYVNANYIDGFQQSRAYIGTQGPLPSTFDCFWRMVWEQRVVIIVMITNLVERGRETLKRQPKLASQCLERKCDMYWPKEGTETYGVIQVKLVKEDVMATYTIRTLQIRHLRLKKKKHSLCERLVYQYHYTNWPDHGTPDHPLPVLSFVKKSSAANPPEAGPIIVHCSAGVGRTGTYIVLDAMLKQIQAKGEVNIFGFLRHIRTQRNFLVQTEEQYIFIHDALLEAIESGETNISQTSLPQYVQQLQFCDTEDEQKPDQIEMLELQFRLITSFQPKDFNLVSANKPCNHFKNRSCILPIESSRVHLTPKPGVDGSDYVNATWIQGFHKLHEFIITQHPMPHTVHDFWQMVWDHNAQTIVMLSYIDGQDFGIFWPIENEEIDCENFKVKYVDTAENETCMTMNVVLQSLQDDYELTTRIIQCPNWPHNCSPVSTVFQLIMLVQELHLRFQNGPVVIVDRYGGTEAATFCCLMTMFKQLKFESSADLYMYAKLYHNKRPGIWRSKDDYFMMYKALACLVSNAVHHPVPMSASAPPDLYLTANGHVNGFAGTTNGCSQAPSRGTGDGEEQPV
ncbi:tyrosine-protein phosphatase 99A-like isoform X1 [Schistocerca cancellata]|uniref:tyrosine-protein phosphatase 99A-like isoform X1 n=2 Tax=Schistocerca cancellata TaxID=274614 RepID=UPI002119A46E|nr:tyrosine-protein phosphatase 99A-like isoform X1 [Schistocerca cancellata]